MEDIMDYRYGQETEHCNFCEDGKILYGDLDSCIMTLVDLMTMDLIKDKKHLLEIVQEDMQFNEAECPFCQPRVQRRKL